MTRTLAAATLARLGALALLLATATTIAACGPPDPSSSPSSDPSSDPPPAPPVPAAIFWEPDLATAQARAAETGRPVLAYFTFDT